MPIEIRLYLCGNIPVKKRVQDILVREFEEVSQAEGFIYDLARSFNFHDLDRDSMLGAVSATKDEYVGTEHDIRFKDHTWSPFGISIEGTVKPPKSPMTRLKDINVEEIIFFPPPNPAMYADVQINGKNLHGEPVWILLHNVTPWSIRMFDEKS